MTTTTAPPVSQAEAPAPEAAAQAFAALGSEPRLEVIHTLVRAGPASTLSHHLRFLSAAGLLSQERQGRSLICRASFANISALVGFLQRECCADAGGPAAHAHPGCLSPSEGAQR